MSLVMGFFRPYISPAILGRSPSVAPDLEGGDGNDAET